MVHGIVNRYFVLFGVSSLEKTVAAAVSPGRVWLDRVFVARALRFSSESF